MNNDELKEEDFPNLIGYLEDRGENLEEFMKSSYTELMFLGTSPNKIGGTLLEAVIFNLRLCIHYYMMKEDYIVVGELKTLYSNLLDTNKKISIDETILKAISVSPN